MGQKLANFVSTTLSGGIGPTETTITVASSAGLPTLAGGDYFYGTIVSVDGLTIEIVKVTARAGAVLTATRGQDATSGATFLAGAFFELRPVAQMMRDMDYTLMVGVANGLAPLNASTKLATSYLQTNVAGGVPLLDGSGLIGDAQIPAAIARDAEVAAAYATIASLSSYLTTASAASTYATIASLSSYLTTASAASTYETQSHATSTYLPKAGGAVGGITIGGGKLLSKITVSSSAPGTLADGELYLKY